MSPFVVPIDGIIVFFCFTALYYSVLFALAWREPKLARHTLANWGFIILIPAHNEALVIESTLKRAQELPGNTHIVVIDDGSTDATADLVRPHLSARVHLLRRKYPNARQGKGAALNYAYIWLQQQYGKWFTDLPLQHIVVTVLDADGYLDKPLLAYIAAMLDENPKLGGVQTPVTIQSPNASLWLRMQDLEFVGFSCFVQRARHWFSSVGLGGNGQFVRASALKALGSLPWTTALSEDLDLGLRLLVHGYRLGYCAKGFVHQQGLTHLKPLLRQRTRWIQGHYQAWRYLPQIWRAQLSFSTKLDTTLYLILVASVWVIVINSLLSLFVLLGLVVPLSAIFQTLSSHSLPLARLVQVLLSLWPTLLFSFTYQHYSRHRVGVLMWPTIMALFCLYSWIWVYASFAAVGRMLTGRKNWVKTQREVLLIASSPETP